MSEMDILRDLVAIKSVFPEEKNIGVFLEKFLQKHGFTTSRGYIGKDRFNVFAERGRGGKTVLFYGHMDTVPLYGSWKSDPLRLTEKGDRLYGLGTHDMKGGIAAALESACSCTKHVKMLFCVDEENISQGAWAAVRNNREWFRDVKVILTGEAGVTDENEGGIGIATLGRRGRCVITVEVEGLSSHGAEPNRGLSALEQAAKIALGIRKIKTRSHGKLGKESIFVREINSSSTSLAVPDKALLDLDMHLVPPSTINDAKKRVESYVKSLSSSGVLDGRTKVTVSVKKRPTQYLEPYITDSRNAYVRKVLELQKGIAGRGIELSYGRSVADENVFFNALGIPNMTIGPRGGNEHTANEWVSKHSLRQVTELFSKVVETL